MSRVLVAVLVTMVLTCAMAETEAADIVVVHDEDMTVFFGFHGSSLFADQPEILWDDTVSWAAGGSAPGDTNVLLFTYDGTVSAGDPANVDAIGFHSLLTTAGYTVSIDNQLNFASRTDYTGFDLVVFPNFGYTDPAAPSPDNVIAAGIAFITMEPAHTDELGIGTGVTVFSGTLSQALVVDNDHVITDAYGLWSVILMANTGSGVPNDVPTDGITTSGEGRVLIGEVPEPASMALLGIGAAFGLAGLRRRGGRR